MVSDDKINNSFPLTNIVYYIHVYCIYHSQLLHLSTFHIFSSRKRCCVMISTRGALQTMTLIYCIMSFVFSVQLGISILWDYVNCIILCNPRTVTQIIDNTQRKTSFEIISGGRSGLSTVEDQPITGRDGARRPGI